MSLFILAICPGAGAQDNNSDVRELGTNIIGNQEQPKVLYLVPWKAAYGDVVIPYRPISGQTDRVFRHMDRREHQRQLKFLREFAAKK